MVSFLMKSVNRGNPTIEGLIIVRTEIIKLNCDVRGNRAHFLLCVVEKGDDVVTPVSDVGLGRRSEIIGPMCRISRS